MPKIAYINKNFRGATLAVIEKVNEIIAEYAADGYDLTLRQLYYQFVVRGLIANTQKEYNKLGGIVNDGRLAGLIDWDSIVDRTRRIEEPSTWDSPDDIVATCSKQFKLDLWEDQPHMVEVWIEKEALVGVISRICKKLRVPYFACRGYASQSAIWRAGQRFKGYVKRGQKTILLHLGDHDPSGIDMTRDNDDRMEMFMGGCDVRRLALNMDQVREYNPPPNPAKLTDSRADDYISRFGDESWELDALDPKVISDLIENAVDEIRDDDLWQDKIAKEESAKRELDSVAENWDGVIEYLGDEDLL